jgi:UDP-galactopyranose mutase
LVCFSHLRWDFVYQRPQHLLARAAQRYAVLFWEEPVVEADRTVPALRERRDTSGVEVVTPLLPPGLDEVAADAEQRALLDALLARFPAPPAVAWFYTPMAVDFAAHIRAGTVVYDCMDELALFAGASPRLLLCERRLLRLADLVFTGGRSLQAAKQRLHPHVHCFPSAVDAAHFRRARQRHAHAEPADQRHLPQPRIGFFGVLDERLDRALVAGVADLRPDWQIVMLGPVAKIAESDLPRRPNLHWLGRKPYAELPDYLGGWDAGFMPFAINDATRFISPTKTPEFLAAGVPVVSTPIADVVAEYGPQQLVEIAETAPAMVERIARVLQRARTPWLERVDAKLAHISWDATWAAMQRLIEAQAERKRGGRPSGTEAYDWLVVGAGFAGSVLAERIARVRGERVLVVDRRPHVAGNAYDHLDAAGVLIHQYGPHIFHTNAQAVADYLSQFTAWRPYEHRVLARVDGQLVPIPINLDTVNRLFGLSLTSDALEAWFAARAETVAEIRTAEDVVVSRVGRELYEKFFRGYTRKQWGLDPSQLDHTVTARVPVRTNRDDRYFTDTFQNMPRDGYTAMIERMLHHPRITLRLGTEYADLSDRVQAARVVWTGPVDEYFRYAYGRLPYRSLRFRHETLAREWFQPVGTVNYPQTEAFTRITEYKHLTGQVHPRTSITYEYPSDVGEPYYPVPRPENAATYRRYRELADATPNVWFVGRLATYQYMNMDQVVAQALATFRRIQDAYPVGTGMVEAATGTDDARQQVAPA